MEPLSAGRLDCESACRVCLPRLPRALPTGTKFESGTFQSKSGTSVELSNSGKFQPISGQKSMTLYVGNPLCPYGIAYRRAYVYTSGGFEKSLWSLLCGRGGTCFQSFRRCLTVLTSVAPIGSLKTNLHGLKCGRGGTGLRSFRRCGA